MRLPSGHSTTDYSVSATSKGWGSGWPQCSGMAGQTVQVVGPRSAALVQGGVHRRIQLLCQILIKECERRGYLLVKGWCWGASCRAIAGTNRASNHSWGLAMDINAPTNPYTSSGQHDIPDWMFALFRRYGFGVGADYSGRKDWMHFEFMGTPSDSDIMTQLAAKEFSGEQPPPPPPPPTEEEMFLVALTDAQKQEAKQLVHDGVEWALEDVKAIDPLIINRAIDQRLAPVIDKLNVLLTKITPTVDQIWEKRIKSELTGDEEPAWRTLQAVNTKVFSGGGTVTPPPTTTIYTVVAGDTFSGIATKHGITVDELKALNPQVKDIGVINIGDQLNVPKLPR